MHNFARRIALLILIPAVFIQLASCAKRAENNIHIISAKMSKGINEKYMPVDVTNIFPEGTVKVYCWFSWRDAEKNMEILAKWHYITDDIPIVEYSFAVPRREGVGSVSLSMPEGKVLPPGLYRVELMYGPRTLKSLTFKVVENVKEPEKQDTKVPEAAPVAVNK
jgi:hypothetical protein